MAPTTGEGGTAIILMEPSADPVKIEDMERRFEVFLASGVEQFLIDFSECDYINSSVLALLVRIKKKVACRGGSLSLVNVPPSVVTILHTTNLDGYLLEDGDS